MAGETHQVRSLGEGFIQLNIAPFLTQQVTFQTWRLRAWGDAGPWALGEQCGSHGQHTKLAKRKDRVQAGRWEGSP